MIADATSTSEQFAPDHEIAGHATAALKKAKEQGKPFVLPWLLVVDTNHQHGHEENDCGCGCSPID